MSRKPDSSKAGPSAPTPEQSALEQPMLTEAEKARLRRSSQDAMEAFRSKTPSRRRVTAQPGK